MKCKYFELIKSKEKDELDDYYCWHPKNMESECEFAICPLSNLRRERRFRNE